MAARPTRRVFFAPDGFVDCAAFERASLPADARIVGPAIIEERDSTTVLPPGWEATVVGYGVLALARRGAEEPAPSRKGSGEGLRSTTGAAVAATRH